jgi:hypothetical protein
MRADKLFAIDHPALLLPLFRHCFVLDAAGLPVLRRCLSVVSPFLPSKTKDITKKKLQARAEHMLPLAYF